MVYFGVLSEKFSPVLQSFLDFNVNCLADLVEKKPGVL